MAKRKNEETLYSLPKKAQSESGILAFTSVGVCRCQDNGWKKVFMTDRGIAEFLELSGNVNGRFRLSVRFGSGDAKAFITVMSEGNSLEEAKKKIENSICLMKKDALIVDLPFDEEIKAMALSFHREIPFSYPTVVRGKKDFAKEVLYPIDAEEQGFVMESYYGTTLVMKEILSERDTGIITELKTLPGDIFISLDVEDMNSEDLKNYVRAMERHYITQLPKMAEQRLWNISLAVTVLAGSKEEREVLKDAVVEIFKRNGILLSVAYGMQEKATMSAFLLGMKDERFVRCADVATIKEIMEGARDEVTENKISSDQDM